VRILPDWKEVYPNAPAKDSGTPLSLAAGEGNEEVVRILLERDDVNPSTAHHSCQTAASWAARNGYDRIEKLVRDRAGPTPQLCSRPEANRPLLPRSI